MSLLFDGDVVDLWFFASTTFYLLFLPHFFNIVLQPSDCQKLIKYLCDCTEEGLLAQLKQINIWYFGKVCPF